MKENILLIILASHHTNYFSWPFVTYLAKLESHREGRISEEGHYPGPSCQQFWNYFVNKNIETKIFWNTNSLSSPLLSIIISGHTPLIMKFLYPFLLSANFYAIQLVDKLNDSPKIVCRDNQFGVYFAIDN